MRMKPENYTRLSPAAKKLYDNPRFEFSIVTDGEHAGMMRVSGWKKRRNATQRAQKPTASARNAKHAAIPSPESRRLKKRAARGTSTTTSTIR